MSTGRRKSAKNTTTASQFIEGTAPEWMSEYSKQTWDRTLVDLDRAGRKLDVLDLETFIGFCQAAGLARECVEIISREGVTVDGGREGTKRHPACSTQNAALSQVRQLAAELGLTAASRGRLPVSGNAADHAKSEAIRRDDPHGYAKYLAKFGRPPINPFEVFDAI